jgi:F-type H+-transporting ATPase subunit delta
MAVRVDAISSVYARSLYELAQPAGEDKIVEVGRELEAVCEIVRSEPAFRELLNSPVVDARRRAESLRRIFDDRVTDLTLRFLLVLNAKGRLGHIESVTEAYDMIVQESYGRVEVDVFTPTRLDDAERATLSSRIQEALGKEPVLYSYTDPSMIGGVRLRIGDQLIDGSVATKLKRLKHGLLQSGGDSRNQLDTFFEGEA